MQINISKLINYFIVANIFGFPMVVVLNLFMGFSTSIGSIVFRALILVSAILLIANAIKIKKQVSLQSKLLIFFWIMYSVRLIYDLSFRQLYLNTTHYKSEYSIYLFAFGGILFPILAIIVNAKYINYSKLSNTFLKASFLQGVLVVFGLYKIFGLNITKIATQRHLYMSDELGENLTNGSPLNPILVSRCGALLIVLFIAKVFLLKSKNNFLIKYLSIPLGLILIVLGGSRGPLLSTIIILFFSYLFFLYVNRLNTNKILSQIMVVLLSGYLLFFTYQAFSESIGVLDRLNSFDSNNNLETGRSKHWNSAINQFIDNPFLGDQIFDKHLWIYPHNLILESFMALGIIGGFLFGYLIISNLLKYKSILRYNINALPVLILFAVFLMFGMSSGGLYNSTEFWVTLTLISIYNINNMKRLSKYE
ncbi:O-antigen ligase family protein [Olleya sp. Ti.3.14]|uniref:O-antigen ligase family protein n=1 Tax=Olleya sp. Ti.3.14 TaxID=3121297 RepID=UPI00311FD9CD